MTFTDNLEKARNGDKRAYGMLCNLSADTLYGIASLVLDSSDDAQKAVQSAFDDGFRGVNRINDENHLCAWLSRELTKHIVARLKEYRAENRTVKSDGSPEKDIFCRLGDLDRLVCALNLGFGYSVKEITVITGLKEETVERKLKDSDKKLGKDKPVIAEYFKKVKAPDPLITKAPVVQDLTVEIDKTDDDELIGEMERIAAMAEAEEQVSRNPAESPRLIRFEPPKFEEKEPEPAPVSEEKPKETAQEIKISISPPKEKEPEPETKPEEPVAQPEKTVSASVPEAKEEPAPTVQEEKTAEPPPEEKTEPQKEEAKAPVQEKADEAPKEIDARTFINVITSQKIKGRDFLKLMGNTRISNEVYREIEQNPNLTKERLIELLESSPLTSADYYKVLTAIKQRNELIARKEQANVLFDIKAKKDEKPEISTDTRSFTAPVREEEIKEEQDRFDFGKSQTVKETPEPEIKPFMPMQDAEPDDEDEEDLSLDDIPAPAKIPAPVKTPAPAKAPDPEKVPAPEKEQSFREKYKGKEFFIDDDVYYPGVNNGKIIFSAVCAVLLIAGSFGIRYLTTGSLLPDGEKQPAVSVTTEKLPESYTSDEDIYKAITLTENVVANRSSDYYKTGIAPFSEALTKDFCETDDTVYISDGGEIAAYSVNPEKPCELYRYVIDDSREFIGFTAENNTFYMVYADSYEETIAYSITAADENGNAVTNDFETVISRDCVTVERYENDVLTASYTQDGSFVAAQAGDEAFNLATTLNTAENAVKEAGVTYLPAYSLDGEERTVIGYEAITVPEEIGYNGFTVIGTLSGSDARASAVLGGSQSFVEFSDNGCRVIISDKNKTYEEYFRFVGSNLTLDSTKTYDGECFGAEFTGENAAVTYDSTDNTVNVTNESGTTGFALAEGETLSGAAFDGNFVHITTKMSEGSMLYCVDLSGVPASSEAKPDAVYSEKLKAYGTNELAGLTVEADESGNRTGLRLSIYGYENGLSEKRYVNITLDEQTSAEYLRYLYADAEESNLRIASGDGYIAVSTVYFDGISEIERILCFRDDGASLDKTTDLLLFDIQSDYRFLTFRDNLLYVITDSRIITIDPETGKAQGYFSLDEQETEAETTPETEQSGEEITLE